MFTALYGKRLEHAKLDFRYRLDEHCVHAVLAIKHKSHSSLKMCVAQSVARLGRLPYRVAHFLHVARCPADKLEDATRLHVRRVYEKYGQNLTRAAEALDVSRNTVRKYL